MLRPTITAILLFFAIVGLLTGCVTPGYPPITGYQHTASPGADQCLDQWGNFQARVNSAEVYDAQHWPLPDYPFLRLNRAASFVSQQDLTSEQQSLWLAQAYERGKQARQIENQKLADPIDLSGLESCLSNLLAGLSEVPAFWSSLRTKIYPDSYLTSRQIIGLYYLFRPLVAWQVEALNEKVTGIFQQYESNNQWQYYRYRDHDTATTHSKKNATHYVKNHEKTYAKKSRPKGDQLKTDTTEVPDQAYLPSNKFSSRPQWQGIKAILDPQLQRDALGYPSFRNHQAQALLSYYHPILALEAGHRDDRIGRPQRNSDRWTVSSNPEVFTLMTHTLWQGQWVPQLVYHWWYPGRPKVGWLDILAGELGGLIWRVTLNWEGEVLFYDSIHPCGCYHKIYPAKSSIKFSGTAKGEELLMVLPVEHPGQGYQPVIEISSIAHYVVGLGFEKVSEAGGTTGDNFSGPYYSFYDYDELRTLRSGDRFLFGPDGLVEGTERLERFLLWNMGVDSPGAMRQWGHHATAFASRRHFDDPLLFSRYFYLESATKTD